MASYKVRGTWPNSNNTLDWPVDTLGEAKAFIDGFNLSDSSRIKDFKIVESRDVVTVISVHTKDVLNIEVFRDLCSHASEKEAEEHLEHLKREGLFDENLDAYDWHFVTVKTEHEVMIGGEND
jgi:hypothetical protein